MAHPGAHYPPMMPPPFGANIPGPPGTALYNAP